MNIGKRPWDFYLSLFVLLSACSKGPAPLPGTPAAPTVNLSLVSAAASTIYPQFQLSGTAPAVGDWVMLYTGADSQCAGGQLFASKKISAVPFTLQSTNETVTSPSLSFRAKWISASGAVGCSDPVSYPYNVLSNATQLAVGSDFTCALLSDATVKCWGANGKGQLGDNTILGHLSPAAVPGLSGVTAISAGLDFACALMSDHSMNCWGGNAYGQLGDGTTVDKHIPTVVLSTSPLGNLASVNQVSSTNYHTCALISGGSVQCWGLNLKGQIGNGNTTNQTKAIPVASLGGTATKVSAGSFHTCALYLDQTVRCWGSSSNGQIGDGFTTDRLAPTAVSGLSSAVDIAAGQGSSCAVQSSGAVQCWGGNAKGQLGDTTTVDRSTPVAASGISNAIAVILSGSAGATVPNPMTGNTCAILADHTLSCWGFNSSGAVGDNTFQVRTTPASVANVSLVSNVTMSGNSTCAAKSNGQAQCWGYNRGGELGSGQSDTAHSVLVDIPGTEGATAVSAGAFSSCANFSDTSTKCWGYQGFAAAAVGNGVSYQGIPVLIAGFFGAVQTVVNYYTSLSLMPGGAVVGAGQNQYYQLADGTTSVRTTPVTVGVSGVAKIVPIDPGTCALMTDGTVTCWGNNGQGIVGQGDTTTRSTPTVVPGLSNVQDLVGGHAHVCAILSDQTVKCWGWNTSGQINATLSNQLSPVAIAGLTSVTELYLSLYFTCALLANQTVKCWGLNTNGELGDGTVTAHYTPASVLVAPGGAALTGVKHLAKANAYGNHICVVMNDNTVRCWGQNNNGQLGDTTTTDRPSPITPAIDSITQISTGGTHTCALNSGGTISCWGSNLYFQMGHSRGLSQGYVFQ